MMTLRNNKYIYNILENSRKMWNEDMNSLSLAQIEWRFENKATVLGIIGKTGILFKTTIQLILLKKTDGNYVLFSPSSKKDKGVPCFLYDIMDIDEFVKRYPIQPVYDDMDITLDDLYDELESIKNKTTRGFIETRKNDMTRIYEIA